MIMFEGRVDVLLPQRSAPAQGAPSPTKSDWWSSHCALSPFSRLFLFVSFLRAAVSPFHQLQHHQLGVHGRPPLVILIPVMSHTCARVVLMSASVTAQASLSFPDNPYLPYSNPHTSSLTLAPHSCRLRRPTPLNASRRSRSSSSPSSPFSYFPFLHQQCQSSQSSPLHLPDPRLQARVPVILV